MLTLTGGVAARHMPGLVLPTLPAKRQASFGGEGLGFQGYLTDKVMGEENVPAETFESGLTYTALMANPELLMMSSADVPS
jgi:hypothetical protein